MKKFDNRYLVLYACCIPVKGFAKSVIYDLQNANYINIPNSLCDILIECKSKIDLNEACNNVTKEEQEIIKQVVDFLIEKDMAFLTNTPEVFPTIDETWQMPSKITNAIVFVTSENISYIDSVITNLDDLGCQAVELRVLDNTDFQFIVKALDKFNDSIIGDVELLTLSDGKGNDFEENIKFLVNNYSRLKRITIYNSKTLSRNIINDVVLEYIDCDYSVETCGVVSHRSLVFSVPFYTEAKKFNTCLNKKICITLDGDVKNCVCSKKVYGNVKNEDLESIIESSDFKRYDTICKDQIEVCKDCEFRYACMDCRVFTDDASNNYSRPSKCLYNPYIAKWKGEDGYIPIMDYGYYDSMGHYVINKL